MSEKHPRVSICIPAYNRADMVGLAIESALNQTYRDLEVVVVDNASTDNIRDVVASFDDPRLLFIQNEENLGLFGNFNRCIEVARGEFLHILHSDDYIDPDFTETCVRFFDEHPDVALTFTSAVIHASGKTLAVKFAESDQILEAPTGFSRLLRERCFITCPSVMVRASVYDEVGKYSLEYPYSSDFYQWLKISKIRDIAYIHDAVIHYRQGEHSESYRLLFESPLGYMDTLKIISQVLVDLGDERNTYSGAINGALRRYIGDCQYAGFTRGGTMKSFSPLLFSGLAWTACTLIEPQSISESLRKFGLLTVIPIAGILMSISIFRRFIGSVLNTDNY